MDEAIATSKRHKQVTEDIFQEPSFLENSILVHGGATLQSAREVTPFNLPKQSIVGGIAPRQRE